MSLFHLNQLKEQILEELPNCKPADQRKYAQQLTASLAAFLHVPDATQETKQQQTASSSSAKKRKERPEETDREIKEEPIEQGKKLVLKPRVAKKAKSSRRNSFFAAADHPNDPIETNLSQEPVALSSPEPKPTPQRKLSLSLH